jgi:hypothetical protein
MDTVKVVDKILENGHVFTYVTGDEGNAESGPMYRQRTGIRWGQLELYISGSRVYLHRDTRKNPNPYPYIWERLMGSVCDKVLDFVGGR